MYWPVHEAALKGNIDTLKWLLDNGAQIDAPTKEGLQPIHYACQGGHIEAVELLVNAGANIHAESENG